jgi:hypothetical protein
MALNFRSMLPSRPVAQYELAHSAGSHDQLVTVCAASLALLVVAAIAVLLGMV